MDNNSVDIYTDISEERKSDQHQQIQSLEERIKELENEKHKIREEFDIQRAKMKELFILKEEELKRNTKEKSSLEEQIGKYKLELDEVRSQLLVNNLRLESDLEIEKRKAREEIATLQQLVNETCEESTTTRTKYDSELRKVQQFIDELERENKELRRQQHSSPHHGSDLPSLAPSVMLNAVTKTLARKLGADSFSAHDNLEESMKKAQEDADFLRSLVIPLEEEIQALKDKLRSTDEQLQQCRIHCTDQLDTFNKCSNEISPVVESVNIIDSKDQSSTNNLVGTSVALASKSCDTNKSVGHDEDQVSIGSGRDKSSPTPCDMCNNYEAQLVKEQQYTKELEKQLNTVEKSLERQKDELIKEINFRKDMEEKWNEKKEKHKEQVSELSKRTLCAEQDLHEVKQSYDDLCRKISEKFKLLARENERVQEQIIQIQKENDNLVGKHNVNSQQLQNEMINLPDKVEDLHLLLLKIREDLIAALVGKEQYLEQKDTLKCELDLLRDQIAVEKETYIRNESTLQTEMDMLKRKLNTYEKDIKSINEIKTHLSETLKEKKHLESMNNELRIKVSSLQQDLDMGEAVQKDFVRLSQSLQVELEKIRGSDTQVRWQHDEDVSDCPTCRNGFSSSRKKIHCRHCGCIFCNDCLSHIVYSGPNRRPSRVCGVCHTLLNKDTAPYFSTEAPHSPD